MSSYHLIGVDPGWGGGIAVSPPDGPVEAHKMPLDELGIWRFFTPFKGCAHVMLELVHAMGTNGCKANFLLGKNKGALIAAFRGLDIVFEEVSPVLWMKRLQPLPRGDGTQRTARKKAIKEIMQARYPHLKLTNATADAVGILDYSLELSRNPDKAGPNIRDGRGDPGGPASL